MIQIEQFSKFRDMIHRSIDGLSEKQILQIPEGFSNNIWWNVAHLVVSTNILVYQFSGLEIASGEKDLSRYRKNTSPRDWTEQPDEEEVSRLKKRLLSQPRQLASDYHAGVFKEFQEYTTSSGVDLKSVEDAISYLGFHEGIHLGSILALKKLV